VLLYFVLFRAKYQARNFDLEFLPEISSSKLDFAISSRNHEPWAAKEVKEVKAQAVEADKEAKAHTAKAKAQAKPAPTPTPTPSSTPCSTPTHRPAPPAKLQHTDSRVEKETHVGVNDFGLKAKPKTKGTGKKDNC